MSGGKELSTAKDQLDLRDKILNEYEKIRGIPELSSPGTEDELNLFLKMDRDTIEKLSFEACAYNCYRLAQFSFYIKRLYNREKARVSWARVTLKKAIAKEINSYKGYGYEEKMWQAIKGNEHAWKLHEIETQAQQRCDRLDGLADMITSLANYMKSVQFTKGKNNG